MNHTEFQGQLVEFATMMGWHHLHVRRTIGKGHKWVTGTNIKGWPDLMLMRPPTEVIIAELKIPPDGLSDDQKLVIGTPEEPGWLREFTVFECYVWTPADMDDILWRLDRRRRRVS